MRPDAIARRYARALFALAKTQGCLDAVDTALGVVTDALTQPSVMRVLTGPVQRDRKRSLLLEIIDNANAPTVVRDFFLLLSDHGRLRHAEVIRTVFDGLLDRERGIIRAVIRSATALAGDVVDEITQAFSTITRGQVVANVEVDPELIAGVIVEVEGRVYDGSLRTELGKLQHQMATAS